MAVTARAAPVGRLDMAAQSKRAALAALFTCASVLQAGATSNLCRPGAAGGKATLNFGIKPAMVVHDDATMAATFAQAGLTPSPGLSTDSKLFSFARTIDALLSSAGELGPQTPEEVRDEARAEFVDTLLSSLRGNTVMVNRKSGLLIPLDDRTAEEGAMSAERMLDENDPEEGLRPRALFNRFDLAPADWSHCGEYRVVYATNPANAGTRDRLFLIFEAMMPNPAFVAGKPGVSEAGCRAIAELWAKLPGGGDAASVGSRAATLSKLYYDGIPGVTTLGPRPANPILSFHNLGGDGGRGQVRANMFFNGGDWQLREWLTQRTADGLAFIPETVKDNPPAELFADDFAATALAGANIGSVAQALHADFITHFFNEAQHHVMTERTPNYRNLVDQLNKIDAGTLSEDNILVSVMGLGSDDRFNDFESISHPAGDEITKSAGPKFKQALGLSNTAADRVNTGLDIGMRAQEADVILARAEAGTCSGCHQSSPRDGVTPNAAIIRVKPDGSIVRWPDVVPKNGGFVHVHEDGTLSVALEEHFLPTRRLILGSHLCKALPAEGQAVVESMAAVPSSPSITATSATDPVISEQIYFADTFLRGFGVEVGAPGMATTLAASRDDAASGADGFAALAEKVRESRETEREMPGAFVEHRRPH